MTKLVAIKNEGKQNKWLNGWCLLYGIWNIWNIFRGFQCFSNERIEWKLNSFSMWIGDFTTPWRCTKMYISKISLVTRFTATLWKMKNEKSISKNNLWLKYVAGWTRYTTACKAFKININNILKSKNCQRITPCLLMKVLQNEMHNLSRQLNNNKQLIYFKMKFSSPFLFSFFFFFAVKIVLVLGRYLIDHLGHGWYWIRHKNQYDILISTSGRD